jgi:hypothetical protein
LEHLLARDPGICEQIGRMSREDYLSTRLAAEANENLGQVTNDGGVK